MRSLPPVRLRRALGIVALALGAALIPASVAAAHAELTSTDPADGSIVDAAPKAIKEKITKEEADKLKGLLEAAGGKVVIK